MVVEMESQGRSTLLALSDEPSKIVTSKRHVTFIISAFAFKTPFLFSFCLHFILLHCFDSENGKKVE
jgi:hypothetical protein